MAEGNGAVYNGFKKHVLEGEMNLTSDTLNLILVASHTPDIDAHDDYSDVSADEFSDASYSTGGNALDNNAVTQDDANDRAKVDADDEVFTSLDGGTPSHAILMDDTVSPKYLILYWELGRAANGGNYTIQFHANGIMLLT